MIKLIIVDDEILTREGLEKCIPWKSIGINVVGKADDGVMALELSKQLQPDIILCDIKMPKMNGIKFAYEMKEKLPECKIIFISGFMDKEYLLSAIDLQAVNYVEKPININHLTDILRDTASSIIRNREKHNENIQKSSRLEESIPIILQHIALYLLTPQANIQEIEEKFKLAGLQLPLSNEYITVLYRIVFKLNDNDIEKQDLLNQVIYRINEFYKNKHLFAISGIKDNEHIVSNISVNLTISTQYIETVLKDIHPEISKIFANSGEIILSYGIGSRISGIENTYFSYQQAAIALQQSFYSNSPVFVSSANTYDDLPLDFGNDVEKQFSVLIKQENQKQIEDFIYKTTELIRKYKNTIVNHIKNIFYNLLNILDKHAKDRGIDNFYAENIKTSIWNDVIAINSLNDLRDYTIEKITRIFELLDVKDNTFRVVFEVMKFIQNNYQNNHLSIKHISEYLHLTRTYLCTLFKKETGKTINNYITEIRVEKSKELLKNREIKLYELSKSVGYSNPKYFASVFKKATGLAPSAYRERC